MNTILIKVSADTYEEADERAELIVEALKEAEEEGVLDFPFNVEVKRGSS